MQAAAAQMRGGRLVGLDVEIGHVGQECARRGAQVAPALRLLVGEQRLQRHVEAHHSGGDARAEHAVGGVRVLRDVRLGPGIHIAGHGERAAHQYHASDLIDDFGGTGDRSVEVRQRAGRHVHEVLAVGLHGVDDEVHRRGILRVARGVRDHRFPDAVLAVDEARDLEHLERIRGARVVKSAVHLDFGVAEQFGDRERVAHTLLHQHIAVGAGDANEFHFRTAERVRDGKRIIDAGVQIKNHLLHGSVLPH